MQTTFIVLFVCFSVNILAQTRTQSADWIDLSNKSDEAVAKILEGEAVVLAESPAEEAAERVRNLQSQEKIALQSFEQKKLLFEEEVDTGAASREMAQKIFTSLQTDSTNLAAQLDLYERTWQRLRERLNKFPFKAVVLAKAIYAGDLVLVKERMLFESGRAAILQINGLRIISETLVKNNILVRDVIEAATEGKADCQPREWKTIEAGTRRVIYLYGIYDTYPLSEGTTLSNVAAQLQLPVEVQLISNYSKTALVNLPSNVQQEIQTMLVTAERANNETRTNLNTLVHQERQFLLNSGIVETKDVLRNRFDDLKVQMDTKRRDLEAKRRAFESASQELTNHLNDEQRIEIVTQSDLERNRSEDRIKAKLISECLTQFRTTTRSLYSQETSKVLNYRLVETSSKSSFRQVRLQAAKILGIYLSSSDGDIKYTASVAFRFGFDYVPVDGETTTHKPGDKMASPSASAAKPVSQPVYRWYSIEAGITNDRSLADQLQQAYARQGFEAAVEDYWDDSFGRKRSRVLIGMFKTKESAAKKAAELGDKLVASYRIVGIE
ncbi:MAG: SPOR domain-containing protein [bacterium]